MKRTTVMMDEETYARLQLIARRQRTTSSHLIREAVGRYVVEASAAERSPLDGLIGLCDGPAEALGSATEEIVAAAIAAKHGARRSGAVTGGEATGGEATDRETSDGDEADDQVRRARGRRR